MGYVPEWSRLNHAKTGASKPKEGIVEKPIFEDREMNEHSEESEYTTPTDRD